jgi:hypothetical protein
MATVSRCGAEGSRGTFLRNVVTVELWTNRPLTALRTGTSGPKPLVCELRTQLARRCRWAAMGRRTQWGEPRRVLGGHVMPMTFHGKVPGVEFGLSDILGIGLVVCAT